VARSRFQSNSTRVFLVPRKGKGKKVISPALRIVSKNGQVEHRSPVLSQYEQRMRVLELTVQLLIARTSMGDYWAEGLKDAGNLLAALPIATAVFANANRHLQNAVGYCQQDEFGAATFELRALRGHLQRL
jgi:hypothetical protein